jgi:hypothetical protein
MEVEDTLHSFPTNFELKSVDWIHVAQGKGSIKCGNFSMKFQVPTVMSTNIAVFWDVAPCSPVNTDLCFRKANCFHHPDDGDSQLL